VKRIHKTIFTLDYICSWSLSRNSPLAWSCAFLNPRSIHKALTKSCLGRASFPQNSSPSVTDFSIFTPFSCKIRFLAWFLLLITFVYIYTKKCVSVRLNVDVNKNYFLNDVTNLNTWRQIIDDVTSYMYACKHYLFPKGKDRIFFPR
jgi:hypothetical protein